MAENQGEENSPLLGGLNSSPNHSLSPPQSPPEAPLMRHPPSSPDTSDKAVRHQGSMDSGCEVDDNDTEQDTKAAMPDETQPTQSPDTEPEDCPKAGPSGGDCGPQQEGCSRPLEQSSVKVTFVIEGDEEEEELDNLYPEIETVSVPQLKSCLGNRIPSFTLPTGTLSTTSSTTSMPFCRICHHPEGEGVETLISPCRCAGTMKFIHHGCLMKWLEVSGIKSRQVPTCELCNYQFHRRKKFRIRQCQMPSCSFRDKILHCVFLFCVLIMLACAAVTVVCFKQNSNPRINREDTELTNSEVLTLTCGVLFFVAFFVAMYVEVKATDTLYRLCSSFFYMNQTIHIYEYDKKRDDMLCNNAPV